MMKFVYKTDQKASVRAVAEESVEEAEIKDQHIEDLMEEAIKKSRRAGAHLPSNVPVPDSGAAGASASNGRARRSVQMVKDQLIIWKSTLEARLGADIPRSHPVIRWMGGRDQQVLH